MGFPSPGTDNAAIRDLLAELRAQNAIPPLEREQEDLLQRMVDIDSNVPREKRSPFVLSLGSRDVLVSSYGPNIEMSAGDVRTLADAGLLRRSFGSRGNSLFEPTNLGREYCRRLKESAGSPVEQVEAEVRRLVQGAEFHARHPVAYDRWAGALGELWGAETTPQFTDIGHGCRETLVQFITDLVEQRRLATVNPDPQKTIDRLRAVLGATRQPESVQELLLAYFGTVWDLVQRQEHGAQKEGEPLSQEDARRVVFQTMNVMFELDRTLGE